MLAHSGYTPRSNFVGDSPINQGLLCLILSISWQQIVSMRIETITGTHASNDAVRSNEVSCHTERQYSYPNSSDDKIDYTERSYPTLHSHLRFRHLHSPFPLLEEPGFPPSGSATPLGECLVSVNGADRLAPMLLTPASPQ